jgi:hypothetical protein
MGLEGGPCAGEKIRSLPNSPGFREEKEVRRKGLSGLIRAGRAYALFLIRQSLDPEIRISEEILQGLFQEVVQDFLTLRRKVFRGERDPNLAMTDLFAPGQIAVWGSYQVGLNLNIGQKPAHLLNKKMRNGPPD